MLVSHVITRLIVGGAQENTIATVLGLEAQSEFSVEILSGPTPADQPEGSIQHLVEKHDGLLHLIPDLVRPVAPWRDLKALVSLWCHFRRRRPAIVHTHSGKAGILGRLAAWLAGVPVIVHSIHGPSFGSFQGKLANLVFQTAERLAGRLTHSFIGVAEAMCQQYLKAGIGHREQYRVVFSGFDLAPFLHAENSDTLRSKWGIGPDDFVVGKVGRLFRLKGHDDLFAIAPELFRRVPQAKLMLVGGGEWRDRFERMAKDLGIADRILFTGLVPPRQVPELIGLMDVVVHLSRREGLPRVIPQALAAGKPVVAMDCDGAREACLHGKHGFMVSPGDRDAVLNRVVELASDPVLRSKMGTTGRQFVEQHFSEAVMVDQIREIYRALLRERNLNWDEAPNSTANTETIR